MVGDVLRLRRDEEFASLHRTVVMDDPCSMIALDPPDQSPINNRHCHNPSLFVTHVQHLMDPQRKETGRGAAV